jgi:hypothetical protein
MKKIINGHGSIVDGLYVQSPLDKIDDMKFIKEFHAKTKALIEKHLGKSAVYKRPHFDNLMKHGGESTLLSPKIELNTPNFLCNRSPMIFLNTEVWPCGYSEGIFKRSFTIKYTLNGSFRYKYQKKFIESEILGKYILADNLEDALNQFESFLQNEYLEFMLVRVKKNLPIRNSSKW